MKYQKIYCEKKVRRMEGKRKKIEKLNKRKIKYRRRRRRSRRKGRKEGYHIISYCIIIDYIM